MEEKQNQKQNKIFQNCGTISKGMTLVTVKPVEEKGENRHIWGNNSWKFYQTNDRHQAIYLGFSENTKQNK